MNELIRLITEKEKELFCCPDHYYNTDERIAEVARHLVQSGVILPPVNVGDNVFEIYEQFVFEYTVSRISFSDRFEFECREGCDTLTFTEDDIGRTVFLDYDEVENHLGR